MEPLIVYIIGDNRSGSTLLDYLLSCHPDAVSVGELHHLHDYYVKTGLGRRNNWECNCGKSVQICPFWKKVLDDVGFTESFDTMIYNIRVGKLGYINSFFLKREVDKISNNPNLMESIENVIANRWKLYESIFNVSERSIIIDSSKNVWEAYFLNRFKKGQIKFLLLERDIWQVGYSKLNRINNFPEDFKIYMKINNTNIYKHILYSYVVAHRNRSFADLIENESGQAFIRAYDYGKLVSNPKKVLSNICTYLQIDPFLAPSNTNDGKDVIHTLHGSPSRKEKKPIAPDLRWKKYYKREPLAFLLAYLLQLFR